MRVLALQLIDFDGQIFMCVCVSVCVHNGTFHSLQAHAGKFEQMHAAMQTHIVCMYMCGFFGKQAQRFVTRFALK